MMSPDCLTWKVQEATIWPDHDSIAYLSLSDKKVLGPILASAARGNENLGPSTRALWQGVAIHGDVGQAPRESEWQP